MVIDQFPGAVHGARNAAVGLQFDVAGQNDVSARGAESGLDFATVVDVLVGAGDVCFRLVANALAMVVVGRHDIPAFAVHEQLVDPHLVDAALAGEAGVEDGESLVQVFIVER